MEGTRKTFGRYFMYNANMFAWAKGTQWHPYMIYNTSKSVVDAINISGLVIQNVDRTKTIEDVQLRLNDLNLWQIWYLIMLWQEYKTKTNICQLLFFEISFKIDLSTHSFHASTPGL